MWIFPLLEALYDQRANGRSPGTWRLVLARKIPSPGSLVCSQEWLPRATTKAKSRGIDRDPPRHVLLFAMWSQREVIDYALKRRSTLQALKRPGRSLARHDACDADPLLIRAAKYHGEPASGPCPVCDSTEMVVLSYVFGEQLGQYSGRIKRTAELEEMAHEFGEFKVVVVEVCPACGWNHMILSYLLGDGRKRKPPRRQQTVEDIYG